MYLDIERAVIAALGATVYARRLRSILKFFSTRCPSAMDAYMDMDKGIAGCTRVNGHVSLSLLCVIGRCCQSLSLLSRHQLHCDASWGGAKDRTIGLGFDLVAAKFQSLGASTACACDGKTNSH